MRFEKMLSVVLLPVIHHLLYICKCLSEFSRLDQAQRFRKCYHFQLEGARNTGTRLFTIHFLMAIRAVQDPHGLFAIQNAIENRPQDPGLELVCGDIKLFRTISITPDWRFS